MSDTKQNRENSAQDQQKLRVALVDDLEQVARDLKRIIQSSSDFQFTHWYSSGPAALRAIEADGPPDLLMMDLELGDAMSGIQCIATLKESLPEIKIVAYTVFEDVDNILAAIQSGAAGYLLKDTPPDLLLAELKVMHLGGAPLTPGVAQKIIQYSRQEDTNAGSQNDRTKLPPEPSRKLLRRPGAVGPRSGDSGISEKPEPAPTRLSEREIEILNCVSVGMSYPRIANSLDISVHTVRRHIEKIYEKLNVHSRLDAVLKGRRIGLIQDA